MQTKHCHFCHAVQRADAHICSRCGRTLLLRKSRESAGDAASPSLPPASPHRAGHYAGLHPEDQPYQTNQILAVPWSEALVDLETEMPLEHEPERIILPHSRASEARTDGLSSAPTRPTLSVRSNKIRSKQAQPSWPQQPKKSWFSEKAIPILITCSGLFFLLASSVIAFGLMEKRSTLAQASVKADRSIVRTGDTFKLSGDGFGASHVIKLTYDVQEAILDDKNQPLTANSDEMGKFVISIRVPSSWQAGPHTLHSRDTVDNIDISTNITIEQVPASPADWQLSDTTLLLDATVAGVGKQKIRLISNVKREITWQATHKQAWLSVTPDHGVISNRPQQIEIQVEPGTLAPNIYTGVVTFSQIKSTAPPLLLTVSMQVRPGPATPRVGVNAQVTLTPEVVMPGNLEVAPTSLAMNAQAGQQASPQTLTLQNNGGMYLDWTVNVTTADQGKWLSVTPGSGTVLPGVQSTITVHTDATALKAGSYQGTLTFAAGGLSKPVPIALTVTTPPVTAPPAATIMLQPTSLAFNTYKGSNPSPQTLKLTNSGNAPLNWSASLSSELTNAFTINPAQGSNLQPGNSTQITVNPNLAGNDVGTLSGTMTVVDSDSGSKVASQSASITVSILAQPQATISVSTNTLNFANTSTPTQQSPQQLVIQNTGAADLHWSITQSDGKDWLSLDNTSGTIAPGSSSSLVITCHTRHLPPGTYNAILTVYDSDANSSVVEQKVQVVLTVKG